MHQVIMSEGLQTIFADTIYLATNSDKFLTFFCTAQAECWVQNRSNLNIEQLSLEIRLSIRKTTTALCNEHTYFSSIGT